MIRTILWLLFLGTTVLCEIYTSTHRMEEALRKDVTELAKNLESYIAKERQKLTTIKSAVRDMKQLHRDLIPVTADAPGNPLAYFTFTSSFVKQWNTIEGAINESDIHDGFRAGMLNSGFKFPSRGDMLGLMDDMVKSQPVFNLNASDIASGYLLGRVTTPLSSRDCFDIAKRAFAKSMERLSVEWLGAAISRLENSPIREPETVTDFYGAKQNLDLQTLEELREFAEKTLGRRRHLALKTYSNSDKLKKLTGKHKRSRSMLEQVELINKFRKGDIKHAGGESHRNLDRTIFYERLCQGIEEQKYKKKKSKFYRCFYADHENPYYRLRRIKMELKHLKPLIVILHDVIYDDDIHDMKEEVLHRMKRSVVRLDGAEKTVNVESRISISAYLEENGTTARRLSKRISSMTHINLSPQNVEGYKVSNYGPVGPFDPHVDFWSDEKMVKKRSTTGTNRLLTVLSYLNNVDYGGSTVFPYLKVRIEPTKGSLVIFINLNEDGSGTKMSTHASCPVVFGNKWIVAKYVHYKGQNLAELERFAVSGLDVK